MQKIKVLKLIPTPGVIPFKINYSIKVGTIDIGYITNFPLHSGKSMIIGELPTLWREVILVSGIITEEIIRRIVYLLI